MAADANKFTGALSLIPTQQILFVISSTQPPVPEKANLKEPIHECEWPRYGVNLRPSWTGGGGPLQESLYGVVPAWGQSLIYGRL